MLKVSKISLKVLLTIIFSIIILFIIYIINLNPEDPFLSFLRFKEYQKENTNTGYDFNITNSGDSLFKSRIGYHTHSWKRTISWFGDTLNTIPSSGTGSYMPSNITEFFLGYDTSLIQFTKNEIIPLKQGTTKLILKYPLKPDTIKIHVNLKGNRLVVETDKMGVLN